MCWQLYYLKIIKNEKRLEFERQFEESNEKFNQNYDEVFISVFTYNIRDNKQESFFVEHNECLNDYDINLIKELSVDKIMEDQG